MLVNPSHSHNHPGSSTNKRETNVLLQLSYAKLLVERSIAPLTASWHTARTQLEHALLGSIFQVLCHQSKT